MKAFLVNYNFTPSWLLNSDLDYIIADRSDDGIDHLAEFDKSKIIRTENFGQVDFDKLCYLVDNYDNLPEVFLWGKTNLFKYISKEEYDQLKDNQFFTPLLTQNHKTYSDMVGPVCYYSGQMYHERKDVSQAAFNLFDSRYFRTFNEFAQEFALPSPLYLPFAPGGSYILTRERVHRYSRDFYDKMASMLDYCQLPAEAQMMERCYYLLWK